MNKNKKRLIYIITLCFSVLFIYLLFSKSGQIFDKNDKISIIKNPKKILITDGESTASAEIEKNKWISLGFPADDLKIKSIIEKASSLQDPVIVSQKKEKFAEFGIKDNKYIKFDDLKMFLGDQYGSFGNYVLLGDQNTVYGVKTDFNEFFYPVDFRDMTPDAISSEKDVTEFSLENNTNTLFFTKKNNEWIVNGKKANREKVDFLINDIKTLKASDIQKIKDVEIVTISAVLKMNISENKKQKKVNFYQPNENTIYLIEEKKEFIYTLDPSSLLPFQKTEVDFM